jgi:hypothetical protein
MTASASGGLDGLRDLGSLLSATDLGDGKL